MRPTRPAAAIVAVLLALPAAAARAADAPDPALAAAAAVRAKVPTPLEPEEGKPSLAFEFEGDLVVAGENAGRVHVSVDVGTFRDAPVWLVSETVVQAWGGSEVTTEASYWLSRDLALLKGEWQRTTADRRVRLDFRRDGPAFVVNKEEGPLEGAGTSAERSLPAPEGATYGRGAVLLFLKYAPASAATYDLPLVGLDALMPTIDEHEPAPDAAPLRLEVKGAAKYGTKPDVADSWLAVWRHGGRVADWHLDPKDRHLLGIEVRRPPGTRIVPKGKGGPRAAHDDDAPATTWKACFLKFGHGYHMAVPKWLDAAFHWDSMYAHDTSAGSWPKERPIEDLKKAYIDEFLARSKHRPRADADALLQMTLATGEEKTQPDGTVVLATHPEFGGNTFHFRAIGGIWYIVRVDQ
ncbi:MAG: hypothetical protein IT460_13070 [Planctomycetes bacterium]|nr:hypothetical protein [Planctomycetota bacterium]